MLRSESTRCMLRSRASPTQCSQRARHDFKSQPRTIPTLERIASRVDRPAAHPRKGKPPHKQLETPVL